LFDFSSVWAKAEGIGGQGSVESGQAAGRKRGRKNVGENPPNMEVFNSSAGQDLEKRSQYYS
jgi:hypothetical protein